MTTCNRLDLETLRFWPIMPKKLPGHCLRSSAGSFCYQIVAKILLACHAMPCPRADLLIPPLPPYKAVTQRCTTQHLTTYRLIYHRSHVPASSAWMHLPSTSESNPEKQKRGLLNLLMNMNAFPFFDTSFLLTTSTLVWMAVRTLLA